MALDFNERAVVAAHDRLTVVGAHDLATCIAAVNARTDAFVAGNPAYPPFHVDVAQQVLMTPPVVSALSLFPTVAIVDGQQELQDDTGFSATGLYTMTVVAFITDTDPTALGWKLRRYSQALAESLLWGRCLGNGTSYIGLRSVRPGRRLTPTDPTQVQTVMSFIMLDFVIKDEQDDIP